MSMRAHSNVCVCVLRRIQFSMELIDVHVQFVATGQPLSAVLAVVDELARKVDAFHVHHCPILKSTDFSTQSALKLAHVFPLSEFLDIFMQVLSNFTIVLHLHLQCSQ